MMSLTHMATQSMPMVSCLSSSWARRSLVPTPSVPETRTGSVMPEKSGAKRPPKPPMPETAPGILVRSTKGFISRTPSYPAVMSTPAAAYAAE